MALQELLLEGSETMLKHQQVPSGTELASLYIKHLQEHQVHCSDEAAGIELPFYSHF